MSKAFTRSTCCFMNCRTGHVHNNRATTGHNARPRSSGWCSRLLSCSSFALGTANQGRPVV